MSNTLSLRDELRSSILWMFVTTSVFLAVLFLSSNILNQNYQAQKTQIVKSYALSLKDYLANKKVQEFIKEQNKSNADLSIYDILEIDRNWREEKERGSFYKQISINFLSESLKKFQLKNPDVSEILMTDQFGCNIAATNLTSDFYQADEAWWTDSEKSREILIGKMEYDESANVWSYPVYFHLGSKQDMTFSILKAVIKSDAKKRLLTEKERID